MRRRRWAAALAAMVVALAANAYAAAAAAEPAPPARPAPAAADVQIEWKDSWQATYELNKERWRKELESPDADAGRRSREWAGRLTRLAQALVERFPDDAAGREADYKRLADDFVDLGPAGGAGDRLRLLLALFPGNVGVAAATLDAMLARATPESIRDNTDGAALGEYASSHAIALHAGGLLPDGHPLIEKAWKTRLALRLAARRYWDAAQALDRLAAITGRNALWVEQRAHLLAASGRIEDAVPLFRELSSQSGRDWFSNHVKDLQKSLGTDPDFPRDLGLEMKWAAIRSRTGGADTSAVQALLDESSAGQGLMPTEDGRRASAWVLVDRLLATQKPEILAPLRQAQQQQVEEALQRARRSGQMQAMLQVFRRFPWAPATHEAMVAAGEDALRRGWSGLALRTFEDVLSHGPQGETQARAQAGLWLALANETRDPETLRAAFAGASADATFPWLGERLPAAQFQKRLLDALKPAAPAPAGTTKLEWVRIPPAPPWDLSDFGRLPAETLRSLPAPLGSLQTFGRNVLVAGPRLLALFGDDLSKPLWWRTATDVARQGSRRREGGRASERSNVWPAPGPFRPAMAGGRVFSRWGIDSPSQCARAVAAFDAETGETLWSTDDDPAWDETRPVSDPVAADGRIYVLAVQEKFGAILPMYLVCLDAASGALLWQRPLGSQNPALPGMEGGRREAPVEMIRYGNAVTVDRGAVYCVTNLGFVARCDARDGLVEWVSTYPQVHAGLNWPALVRRQGAAPVAAGDRVICLPRDYQGLFALDARTGKRLWDAPLVPSDEMVGLSGGAVLVTGADHLLALDIAGGRVLWDRRFEEGIRGPPVLAGNAILVAAAGKLLRVDAATGGPLEAGPSDPGETLCNLAVRGGSLLAVSPLAAETARIAPAPARPPAALPLRQAWSLSRSFPDMWVPPAEAKVSGKLYLASRGMLECIEMGSSAGPVWQRFINAGSEEPLWAEGMMILVRGRRLLAVDAQTGAARWQCDLPFPLGLRKVCPPYLVVAAYLPGAQYEETLGLVDLATGRLLWTRTLEQPRQSFRALDFGWDGKNLHCLGEAEGPRNRRGIDVVLRDEDGQPAADRPLPPDEDSRPRAFVVAGGTAYCLTYGKALYELSLADGTVRRLQVDLTDLNPSSAAVTMKLTGPWLQIRQPTGRAAPVAEGAASGAPTGKLWVLRRGDPSYQLSLDRIGDILGDTLYIPAGLRLTALDLVTRKEVTYEAPGATEADGPPASIFDFCRLNDRVWIATTTAPTRQTGPTGLRLDVFDAATGTRLRGQNVAGVFPEDRASRRGILREEGERRRFVSESRILWNAQAVYVTDAVGLHALVAAPADAPIDSLRYLAPLAGRPVTTDGLLQEWDDRSAVPLEGPGGRKGRVYLAHDAANLYLAVRCQSGSFVPHIGGGGAWLEIGLTTNKDSYHWAVGADARGRAKWESLSGHPLPKGITAAVRHDPGAGEIIYEAAIPRRELIEPQRGESRRLGVSLAVWDEQPDAGGSTRVLTWGDAFQGRSLIAEGHRPVQLYPLTQQAVEAMAAVISELPELPESFDYLKSVAALRATSADDLLELYADFLRRRPQSITVERLLTIDQALRVRRMEDPSKKLLEIAAKAGVAPSVCRRYEQQAQAYISQWIYMEPVNLYPRSIVFELDDGIATGQAGWNHRVYWVKPYWPWNTPRPAMQMFDRIPPGTWHELRIPLVLLGMNDVPICGVSFAQQGEPRLVWDRTALVFNGKEEVILGDALPEGASTGGTWEWLDTVARATKMSHAHAAPEQRYEVAQHWCTDFTRPIMSHVTLLPDGAYLSQWVYLDPKDTPRTISLALHDGKGWRYHAIWGAKTCHGRYMGPLLPAGTWQELRLPLAWTGLEAEPIAGVAFAQDGGRAYWDRTVLVAGGKETAIIDGGLPPPAENVPPVWQPWVDTHRGATWPAPGKVGAALQSDGSTGYVEIPHADALEPDTLTVEAWVNLSWLPGGNDARRWLVAKNGSEETDGHYALMLNNSAVGAYLHVGAEKADFYKAFTDQGLLKPGQWSHLAMTFDGRDLKVYFNGAEVASTPVNKKRTKAAGPLNLARRPDGSTYYPGLLDEVRIYNRALTAEEVRGRFAADGGPPPEAVAKSVVGYWGFDNDACPKDLGDGWQWADQPTRSGKRVHTQTPANRFTGHACVFKQPAIQHLPFDRERTLAVLRNRLPDVGGCEESWLLFDRMRELQTTAQGRIELLRWFVQAIPSHPHILDALKALADEYTEQRKADPSINVEARIAELNLAPDTHYAFNRKYIYWQRSRVKAWQLLGPFPNAEGRSHGVPLPPETDGVKLDAVYDGAAGKVRWQSYQTQEEHVDLGKVFTPAEGVLAYAACWIRSDTAQRVVFEVARDDSCKVWLNRQLVVDAPGPASIWGVPLTPTAELPAGWSEVLVKIGNASDGWAFFFEVVDRLGRGLPKGIEISATPPPP